MTESLAAAIGSGIDLGKSLAKVTVSPPDGIARLATFPVKTTADGHIALSRGFQNIPKSFGDTKGSEIGEGNGKLRSELVEAT